jgi:hypothetical protein
LAAAVPAPTSGPAAAPIVEPKAAEPVGSTPPPIRAEAITAHPHSIDPAADGIAPDVASEAVPSHGWFDETELKLSATDDKFDVLVDPSACVYPDSFLRILAGGRDDCGFLNPGTDESEILTLPFLALSGWILVICVVAALYYFHRNWRVRRWLRRMQAQGFVRSPARSLRSSGHRAHRSGRRHRAGSRRYAG